MTGGAAGIAYAFVAADLGATSGRVVLGVVEPGGGRLELTEAHRFPNRAVRLSSGLHWDLPALYLGVLDGFRAAGRLAAAAGLEVASVGVDSWAVDYGLLDADGVLLGTPYHYRDARTEHHRSAIPDEELYRVSGLQHLPFNTVHQLAAARGSAQLAAARRLLLVPDLIGYWLTGAVGAEETNASTTGLFDAVAGDWSAELVGRSGLPDGLLPPIRRTGDPLGGLLPEAAAACGLPAGTPVVAVASHDTASAVAAVPSVAVPPGGGTAFVSCGTWSLAGLELDAPVLTEESRRAGFTNERGVGGTVRYLRNIAGMWALEECRRVWGEQDGEPPELAALLDAAERAEPFAALVDLEDPAFLAPPSMPEAIAGQCRTTGQKPPGSRGSVVRCVLESLALAHRRTIRRAADLSGRPAPDRIHLVGGGSRNALLCRLTAEAAGLPVTAGPAEATALGNVLVQAGTAGLLDGLSAMRELVAATQAVVEYPPGAASGSAAREWDEAERRLRGGG